MDSENGQGKKSARSPNIVQLSKNSSTQKCDFVDEFVNIYGGISPRLFTQWAAISTIAGALERKVWVYTKSSNLFPNLYTVFVAPPGVGKTEMTWRVQQLWRNLESHHVAHTSVTKASLIDLLAESKRTVYDHLGKLPAYVFYSLLIASDELGVLLPGYDMEFMNTLTHLYDGKTYSESRRTNKIKHEFKNTNLNLLAACTPGYLKEMLPPGAWNQGFLSRVILVYAGEQKPQSLFHEEVVDKEAQIALQTRLAEIGELYGQYGFTEEAAQFIDSWHLGGQKPVPEHPRLTNYNTRRTAHLLKLSMIAAASEYDTLLIETRHIRRALDWLIDVEDEMSEIFKAMTSGGDSEIYQEAYHFIYVTYLKENKPIAQFRFIRFLQERTPSHNIARIIEIMLQSKMIVEMVSKEGTGYRPGSYKKIN